MTGYFTHPDCRKHEMGPGHPECPERLDAIEDRLLISGVGDALDRRESCGAHFRSEYQTDEGEALRDDANFCHVSAYNWTGDPMASELNREQLDFETAHLTTRSYK